MMPWAPAWAAAVEDNTSRYWHSEELALIILTTSGRLADVTSGEAPVEHGRSAQAPCQSSSHDYVRNARRTPKGKLPSEVHQETNGGVFTHDWRGAALCQEFQTGACVSGRSVKSPKSQSVERQGNKCLGERHGGGSCGYPWGKSITKHNFGFW